MLKTAYYSIRNIIWYRSLRVPKPFDISKSSDVQEMKDAITEALLSQVGLTLYGNKIGRYVFLTKKQREIKTMVEQCNYSVTIGPSIHATPHRPTERPECCQGKSN